MKHIQWVGERQEMDLRWNREFAMGQVDNDEELLKELLTIFKDSAASDLTVMQQAVEKGDPVEARGAAHSIKGAAASLGLEAIRDMATAMEKDCREGSITVVMENLTQLEGLLKMAAEL
jgi:HPt (histidine-containing phosphotransfer) domain-containing protein